MDLIFANGAASLTLPPGWRGEAFLPFGAELIAPSGQNVIVQTRSYFDPEAAKDPAEALAYWPEKGFDTSLPEAREVFGTIAVFLSDRDPDKHMLVKSLEPYDERFVRVLWLELPPFLHGGKDLLDACGAIAGTWRCRQEDTALERLAARDRAEIHGFSDRKFMMLPDGWYVDVLENSGEGGVYRYAIEDPNDVETVWLTIDTRSTIGPDAGDGSLDLFGTTMAAAFDSQRALWTNKGFLYDGDYMIGAEFDETEGPDKVRRLAYLRAVSNRDGGLLLTYNHCIAAGVPDEKRTVTDADIQQLICEALVVPSPGDGRQS